LGFSFLFQNLFLFKPFSNLKIFKILFKTFQIILKLLKLHTNKQKPRDSKYDAQALVASKIIQKWYLNILEHNLIDNLLFLGKQKLKHHVAYINLNDGN
jgi:hypothetical protein